MAEVMVLHHEDDPAIQEFDNEIASMRIGDGTEVAQGEMVTQVCLSLSITTWNRALAFVSARNKAGCECGICLAPAWDRIFEALWPQEGLRVESVSYSRQSRPLTRLLVCHAPSGPLCP